jgi:hypothetical protein|nr:hypothetical protein [Aspergillus fumigatus]
MTLVNKNINENLSFTTKIKRIIIIRIIIIQNYLIINNYKIFSIILISRIFYALLFLLFNFISYNNLGCESYLYFSLMNYIENELIINNWSPKPNSVSFVPKIPLSGSPDSLSSQGSGRPPGPPSDFHTYLAIISDYYQRNSNGDVVGKWI